MADKYQKLDQITHIRHRPDTYIGSVNNTEETRLILVEVENETDQVLLKAETKLLKFNPGLEQCIQELIGNAVDHAQRTKDEKDRVTKIEVEIQDDLFTICNNGLGVPIEKHSTFDLYVPELIFGNLLTSSNYNDDEKRTWGGTNGIGAKATNIFSSEFSLDICHSGKRYQQTFTNGMKSKTEPVISKYKHKDYTKITCKPDFAAFKLKSFTRDAQNNPVDNRTIICNRIYEMAAVVPKHVSVFLNDAKIPVKEFKDYCDMFLEGSHKKIVYDQPDGYWSVVVAENPFDANTAISFVNGIRTEENGTHVKHVFDDQIIKKVMELIEPKAKRAKVSIKPNAVRNSLIVFVKCLVENPRFNTQTKSKLNTPISDFPKKCTIPEDFITKVSKLGFVENIISKAKFNEMEDMKKSVSSTSVKKNRIVGIPKLDDANWAGTKKSNVCTLILTEGDSAKSTALAGLSIVGKDAWGVFPLKGKMLNVRAASVADIAKNEEITNINKIMGITYNMEDREKLRYNRIMIMTDSDHDGSHIKGLLINYFTFFCPKIMSDGFITSLLTPVVKVNVAKKTINFYDYNTFEKWKNQEGKELKYSQKYYKGLGTSTTEEAKEYFKAIDKNQVFYSWNEKEDMQYISLAFDKNRADDRKEWIEKSIEKINKKGSLIDYNVKKISVQSFIENDLVSFSIYDCMRNLPNMIDGLKISQRKVLYGSIERGIFKVNDKGEIKVAQLGSIISEKTHYHHGEVSLEGTIVGMAQEFVGSGNLQLLYPSGQFGSRNMGGKDSASSRYIFTYLRPCVKLLFNEVDSKMLEYNYEDGNKIEPKFYVPIIPMALVNGVRGIGTGWSCNIPCFNPLDIIDRIKKKLDKPNYKIEELVPYYKKFRGTIIKDKPNKWTSKGTFTRKSLKHIYVSELPIGMWYDNFKLIIDELSSNKEPLINEHSSKIITKEGTDYEEFEITFNRDVSDEEVIKLFKLNSSLAATNLVGFDKNNEIKKYENVEEIIKDHFEYRLKFYEDRKNLIIKELKDKIELLTEKMRFIKSILDETLKVFRVKNDVIIENLIALNFKTINGTYSYLLNMQINNFSEEKIDKLEKEIEELKTELKRVTDKHIKDMWRDDLNELQKLL